MMKLYVKMMEVKGTGKGGKNTVTLAELLLTSWQWGCAFSCSQVHSG